MTKMPLKLSFKGTSHRNLAKSLNFGPRLPELWNGEGVQDCMLGKALIFAEPAQSSSGEGFAG